MTFLHSFFSDSTAFILSVDIHHLFDMICAPPIRDQRDNPASCPNHSYWKMQIFFLIHSYTYVVPISPVPKYSGGHSSEKKKKKSCLESFKSTPFDCVRYFLSPHMRRSVCIGPLVHRVSVRGAAGGDTEGKFTKSPRVFARSSAPSSWSYLLFCSLVYKNMGGSLQQKAYSQQSALSSGFFFFFFFLRPREVVREATGSGL